MYDITVLGRAERTLLSALDDLVVERCRDAGSATLTLRVTDQSALLAVLGTLHDLGVQIEAVRRVH